jgi:hypothetical protein
LYWTLQPEPGLVDLVGVGDADGLLDGLGDAVAVFDGSGPALIASW